MLEAELGKGSIDEFFKSDKLKEVSRRLNITDPNDILAAVGYGDLSTSQVVNRLREVDQLEKMEKKGHSIPQALNERQSTVSSLGGLLHHLAKCCQPVPGEEILGVVTRGSGIAVHRSDCNNLSKIDEDRRMAVDWSKERHTSYPAGLQVECLDRVGIAGDILKKVSDNKVNLKDLKVETHRDKKTATIFLIVDVLDIEQLARVSQAISQISDVIRVHRKDHRKKSGPTPPVNGNGRPGTSRGESNGKGGNQASGNASGPGSGQGKNSNGKSAGGGKGAGNVKVAHIKGKN